MRLRPLLPLAALAAVAAAILAAACHAEPDDATAIKPGAPRKPAAAVAAPCDSKDDPALTEAFKDDFDRGELGAEWRSTSYGAYYLTDQRLCTSKPHNHPAWLRRKLPTNVRIEFEATPLTANGDVKAELFGDGCAFDPDGKDYTATGYVGVLGAHNNAEHWLARMYEHGTDLKQTPLAGGATIATSKLVANTTYHVELSRTDGKTLQFLVDGVVIHTFDDPAPLTGPGHDHFGFNGWEPAVCFDRLVVTPL
ncbi:MAG: hypothetical protein NVSMB47_19850 [Polyangiales bacterium]